MRTFSADAYRAAMAAWHEGEPWSDDWKEWRHLAAMAGIIYPPTGTCWDQWDDDQPSQRAIIVRAMRETPALLRSALRSPRTRSWGDVVTLLLQGRDRMRESIDERRGSEADPTPRAAADVLGRLAITVKTAEDGMLAKALRAGRCPTCGQGLPS